MSTSYPSEMELDTALDAALTDAGAIAPVVRPRHAVTRVDRRRSAAAPGAEQAPMKIPPVGPAEHDVPAVPHGVHDVPAAVPDGRATGDRRRATGGAAPLRRPDPDDLLLEADGRSVPDVVAVAAAVGRSARTAAPVVVADLVALAASGAAAAAVVWLVQTFVVRGGAAGWEGLLAAAWPAAVGLPLLAIGYWLSDLYSETWLHPACELRHLSRVTTAGLLAVAAGGAVAPLAAAATLPAWCLAAWPAALVTVPLFRAVARHCCGGRAWWGHPTLVIAAGPDAQELAGALLRDSASGLRPVLATDPRCRRHRGGTLPMMNDRTVLASAVRAAGIRHAVAYLPDAPGRDMDDLLDPYRGLVPHLLVLPDLPPVAGLWRAARHCGRPSGIEARNGLLFDRLRVAKRATDLGLAAAAVAVSWPALLLIAAAVKLTSRGPLFYGHTRIGRHGRPFKAWKFRTMRPDGDAILKAHLAADPAARAEWERDHKLRDDPRVTTVGRFLRRASLDELPQVLNVFKGEMSLVGPRPIIADEVVRYDDVIRLYTLVRPGITGLWQVSGRNDTTYPERVALDRFYVRHWSPWLDLYVLAKTVTALLGRGGAY